MCDFVGTCLDISKLTPEEIECLEKWLQDRHDHLQAQVRGLQEQIEDSQARIRKVNRAFERIAPATRR
jgi:chaperonin cofactor prefoldin